MSETVLAALIAAGATLVVCLINNYVSQGKMQALVEYKIDELSRRVDEHNKVIERTYRLEEAAAVYEEKMKVANHRIGDLEEKVGVE